MLGSGETSPNGLAVLRKYFQTTTEPQRVAILETPAGFQPNSAAVAADVAKAFEFSLSEFIAHIDIVPARSRMDWPYSPDNPETIAPMAEANCLFIGPGSPSYAVDQLAGTAAYATLLDRWQQGATLIFASAALLAMGAYTLPVYEIYKAGAPLHWLRGLGLLQEIAPDLVLLGHWNNTDGGAGLDTSCNYMGKERFGRLRTLLPSGARVLALDENTGVVIDPARRLLATVGKGTAHLMTAAETTLERNSLYSLDGLEALGAPSFADYFAPQKRKADAHTAAPSDPAAAADIPEMILRLAEERAEAKRGRDFARADALRQAIRDQGYILEDTAGGPVIRPADA